MTDPMAKPHELSGRSRAIHQNEQEPRNGQDEKALETEREVAQVERENEYRAVVTDPTEYARQAASKAAQSGAGHTGQ